MESKKPNLWDGLNPYVQLVIIIVIAIIIFIVVKSLIEGYKKKKQQSILENSIVNTTIQTSTGPVPVSVNLGTKAAAIYGAFNTGLFGATENEEMAMTELLDVPKNLIPNLSSTYYGLYGENLKTDFMKYLSDEEWLRISYLFS